MCFFILANFFVLRLDQAVVDITISEYLCLYLFQIRLDGLRQTSDFISDSRSSGVKSWSVSVSVLSVMFESWVKKNGSVSWILYIFILVYEKSSSDTVRSWQVREGKICAK